MNQSIARAESRPTKRLYASVSGHARPLKAVVMGLPLPENRPSGKILVASASATVSDIIAASANYPATGARTWAIQIAAFPSPKAARDMLVDVKKRYATLLKPAQLSVEVLQSETQAIYRARFIGYGSREEAAYTWERLRSKNVDCYVPKL